MKRIISLGLALMMLFSLISCSKDDEGDTGEAAALVSQGKRVYFSSEYQSGEMMAVEVNDGNVRTAWASDTAAANIDEWICIDLGQNYILDSVGLKWGASRALDYSIEVSRGGVEYTEVYSAADVTSTEDELLTTEQFGKGVVARYVKLRCKKVPLLLSMYMGATVCEMEVYAKPAKDQTLGTETEAMVITKTVVPKLTDVIRGGRSYEYNVLAWSGSYYEYQCTGVAAGAVITAEQGTIEVSIDRGEYQVYNIKPGTHEYLFSDKLAEGTHTVRILRREDPWIPQIKIDSVIVEQSADVVKGYTGNYDMKIEFVGDSITSGGGASKYSNSYVTLAADELNAWFNVVSRAGQGLYMHAGYSDDGGLIKLYQSTIMDRIQDKPYTFGADLVVLNIGTNDGANLRDISEEEQKAYIEEFDKRYTEMIDELLIANPGASILCTCGSMGIDMRLRNVIKEAVAEYKTAHPDVNIDYFFFERSFDATEETAWHPGDGSHARDAKDLVKKIKEFMK